MYYIYIFLDHQTVYPLHCSLPSPSPSSVSAEYEQNIFLNKFLPVCVKPTEHACGLLVFGLSHLKASQDQSPDGMQWAALNTCRSRREWGLTVARLPLMDAWWTHITVGQIYCWLTAILHFISSAATMQGSLQILDSWRCKDYKLKPYLDRRARHLFLFLWER